MVGMQFDEPCNQKVAAEILAGAHRALRNVGDAAVADLDGAFDDPVLENDAGIGKNGFGGHAIDFRWFRRR